ncbi:hypothetical protein O0L34_g13466 [Tuta absoluta]|nr:hypothetical protein O0L34_g13466 [Tuta absoluta]
MSTPPGRKVIHLPKVRMLSRGARQAQAAGGTNTGLKITHVKSIKPPDPDIIKKQEEDKLRAQLQKEIVSRSRSCGYRRYSCPLPVVSGRAYCAKHILSDPTAPYTRCAHERCTAPAKQGQHPTDHQLCFEHARVAMCARQRAAAPPPPVTTTETLLNQLKHYVQPEISRARTTSCASSVSVVSEPAPELEVAPLAVDPFKQIDATTVNANYSAAIMECASASDSEADSVTISAGDPGGDMSDAEDAPAEEMPLWCVLQCV